MPVACELAGIGEPGIWVGIPWVEKVKVDAALAIGTTSTDAPSDHITVASIKKDAKNFLAACFVLFLKFFIFLSPFAFHIQSTKYETIKKISNPGRR